VTASVVGLIGVGALIAIGNVVAMRRIWASPLLETSQKIAQTIFIWLLPGTFLAMRFLLGAPPRRASLSAPLADTFDASAYLGHGQYGPDGGHHGGFDGGGGHHG
jgi:hypothetical protein